MLEASFDNFELMSNYVKAISHEGVVVLDNNIIPDFTSAQLKRTEKTSLEGVILLNKALAEIIQNFSSKRVIVTKESREEINSGLDFVKDQIKQVSGNASLYSQLIESYNNIGAAVNSAKRLQEAIVNEGGKLYESMRNIVRKIVLDFPVLTKSPDSGDGPDEKLVAYAFAQAIEQNKKLFVLSSDRDVKRTTRELYTLLTAKNVVGVDTITGSCLSTNNVEVVCYDTEKKLFRSFFNGKFDAPELWTPLDKSYSKKDEQFLSKLIQRNLVPVEVALGNGKALTAVVKDYEAQDKKTEEDKKPKPLAASLANLDIKTSKLDKSDKAVSGKINDSSKNQNTESVNNIEDSVNALNRLYERFGINPEDVSIEDQDAVKDALSVCIDFQKIYSCLDSKNESLDTAVSKIKKKDINSLIASVKQDLIGINSAIVELRQHPDYLSAKPDDDIRKKEAELNKDFSKKQKELWKYESHVKEAFSFEQSSLSKKQHDFIEKLKKHCEKAESSFIWATNTDIARAAGLSKNYISLKLRKLKDEGLLERKPSGRYTANKVTPEVVKMLIIEKP